MVQGKEENGNLIETCSEMLTELLPLARHTGVLR